MNEALTRFFSYGFRPFFLLGILWSALAIVLWVLIWNGAVQLSWDRIPVYWHAHDMIMGLVTAAIAGFLLTAVANWTSRPPVAGAPLMWLVLVWMAGRIGLQSALISAVADMLFWLSLTGLIARELYLARNKRNYKIVGILLLMTLADALFHLQELGVLASLDMHRVLWAQLWLVILLINVIGGRIIPAFTGNWLRRRAAEGTGPQVVSMPAAFGKPDLLAIVLLVMFVAAILLNQSTVVATALGLLCFCAQLWRFMRWKFWLTLADPLVWMMHLSYAWILVGILLWSLALLDVLPLSAAIHALTIGAVASMIMSVAARAALGHTGRPLQSHWLLTGAIVLMSLGSLSRIMAAVLPQSGSGLLDLAALLWVVSMSLFAIRYLPILLGPVRQG